MKWILSLAFILFTGWPVFTLEKPPVISQNCTVAKKPVKIRMLIFKHSKERIADNDAALALRSLQNGASQGLDIKSIGNHYFTEPVEGVVSNDPFTNILLDTNEVRKWQRFQDFISESLKKDATPRDLVIIFSIGHGGPDGGLHNLGQRSKVMTALANAAEENKQQILWWQLSCYASANLPALSTLPPAQQKLFNIIASSDTRQESTVDLQGRIMDKVFTAIATKNTSIDPNSDGIITAKELDTFLRSAGVPRQGGGPIVYSLTPDTPIFGWKGLDIPVIDRNNPQGKYDDEYVPMP